MYSLSKSEQLQAERERMEAAERRQRIVRGEDTKLRDRNLRKIYGRTRDEMVDASRGRLDAFVAERQDSPITMADPAAHSVFKHTFRDRDRTAEEALGHPSQGVVSAHTYIPRAYYRGGGLLDKKKSRMLRAEVSSRIWQDGELVDMPVVDMLDQRPATSSVVDTATIRGRVAKPQFTRHSSFVLRERSPEKEISGPMTFRWHTEVERVQESIDKNPVYSSGPWEESPASPIWRENDARRWVGDRRFECTTSNHDRTTETDTITGKPFGPSLNASESYTVSPHSVRDRKSVATRFRTREPERELAGNMVTMVPRDRYVESPRHTKLYHLEGVVSSPYEAAEPRAYHLSLIGTEAVDRPNTSMSKWSLESESGTPSPLARRARTRA